MNVQTVDRYLKTAHRYLGVIDEIEDLNWPDLTRDELMAACAAYYYFSAQFVEAVDIACELYPSDPKLIELRHGECDTDNLSPYPGVAKPGEKMNHDEFMRRTVAMSSSRSECAEQDRGPGTCIPCGGPSVRPRHEGDELFEL